MIKILNAECGIDGRYFVVYAVNDTVFTKYFFWPWEQKEFISRLFAK